MRGTRARLRAAAGIARSLALYRGRPRHHAGLCALYRPFVRPGDLVFDIGAHVGDRVRAFRALGARVVAVEPQPALARLLRLLHGRDPGVVVEELAVGGTVGTARLKLNLANPTVATLSADFVAAAGDADGWREQRWDAEASIHLTTLDALIARHGMPAFVKIDAEGFEPDILAGLSRPPPPALSFEVTAIARETGLAALDRAAALGYTRFRLSLGETHRLAPGGWRDAATMRATIAALDTAANSGDVYALLPATCLRGPVPE